MDVAVDQVKLAFDPGSLLLLNVILGVLMLGVAMDIRVADFVRVVRDPRGPLVGMAAQFVLLPAFTVVLTLVIDPLPSVALGMILVAACPGGNMSNLFTYLARGNTALSVSMTALSTAAAIFLTPLNIALWGSLNPKTAAIMRSVELEPLALLGTVALILGLPLAAGMTIGARFPRFVDAIRRPFRFLCVGAIFSFIGFALVKNGPHFGHYLWPIFAAVVVHNATALGLGYGAGRLLRLPAPDCRAVSIEVGIQNSALGLVLIFTFFDGLGGMAITAALWGIWHIVAGLGVSALWSFRSEHRANPLVRSHA